MLCRASTTSSGLTALTPRTRTSCLATCRTSSAPAAASSPAPTSWCAHALLHLALALVCCWFLRWLLLHHRHQRHDALLHFARALLHLVLAPVCCWSLRWLLLHYWHRRHGAHMRCCMLRWLLCAAALCVDCCSTTRFHLMVRTRAGNLCAAALSIGCHDVPHVFVSGCCFTSCTQFMERTATAVHIHPSCAQGCKDADVK